MIAYGPVGISVFFEETADHPEVLRIFYPGRRVRQMQISEQHASVRTTRNPIDIACEVHRKACDTAGVKAICQNLQMFVVVVDDDDARRRQCHFAGWKTRATTAPSKPSGQFDIARLREYKTAAIQLHR